MKSLAYRLQHGVQLFNTIYTWVIDGSEQEVLASGDLTQDTLFYSEKKKKPTINIVAIMSLNFKILYLCPSEPCSIADRQTTDDTKKAWYDLLDEIENGLGDAGFSGLRQRGWHLDIPPSDRTNPFANVFSSYRIRIEQKFAAVKAWEATTVRLRTPTRYEESLLTQHHKIWTVIAVFLNDFV